MRIGANALATRGQRHFLSIVTYACLTYVTTWTIWFAGIWSIQDLTRISDSRFFWFLFAGSFAPTISALVVAGYSGGWEASKNLLRRFVLIKVNWKVYGITFFLLPATGIATYLVLGVTNKPAIIDIVTTAVVLMPLNAFLGGVVFGIGPLGEEMGWRGFLQDRLQGHHSSVVVATKVGLVWAAWHFPLAICFEDFRSGLRLGEFIVLYPVFTILLAFTMGHLWRWSKGSLFIAIFFHAVSNMTVDVYLLNDMWWDFGHLNPIQIYLIILLVFALMASVAELLSRTVFCGPDASDKPIQITNSELTMPS